MQEIEANVTNPSICSSLSPQAINCGGAATTTVSTTNYSVIIFTLMLAQSLIIIMVLPTELPSAPPTSFSTANTLFWEQDLITF